jgi:hypothetical protein
MSNVAKAAYQLAQQNYERFFSAFYNVKLYGAVGDGVTDDTAAIQAAITSIGAGIIFFPPGIYMVTGLTVPSNIVLKGVYAYSQLKLINSSKNSIITIADNSQDVVIEDLFLNGDITNNTQTGESDFRGHGVDMPTEGSFIYKNIHIFHCEFFYCNRGIHTSGGVAGCMFSHLLVEMCKEVGVCVPTDSELSFSYVGGNGTGYGWYATNVLAMGWESRIYANHFWDAPYNLQAEYIRFADIWGNKFENSSYETLLIRGTCEGVRISENKFILNGSDYTVSSTRYAAIQFTDNETTGARATVIRGNDFGIPSNMPYNNYCIAEAENTDDSYITGNYFKYGYQTAPKLIYGANTVHTPNFGE